MQRHGVPTQVRLRAARCPPVHPRRRLWRVGRGVCGLGSLSRLRRPGRDQRVSNPDRRVCRGRAGHRHPAGGGERPGRPHRSPLQLPCRGLAARPLSHELPLLRPVRVPGRAPAAGPLREEVEQVRRGRLLRAGTRRVPLEGRADVPAAEHLEPRPLLQQGPVRTLQIPRRGTACCGTSSSSRRSS